MFPLPRTNHPELGVEVRAHCPGVEDLLALLHHAECLRCRAHVERKLVGIALMVDGSLGFVEAIATARMKLVVKFIGLESVGVASGGYLVGILVLE